MGFRSQERELFAALLTTAIQAHYASKELTWVWYKTNVLPILLGNLARSKSFQELEKLKEHDVFERAKRR
jgi:hypothetical protein